MNNIFHIIGVVVVAVAPVVASVPLTYPPRIGRGPPQEAMPQSSEIAYAVAAATSGSGD
jgi:hypothetical protein